MKQNTLKTPYKRLLFKVRVRVRVNNKVRVRAGAGARLGSGTGLDGIAAFGCRVYKTGIGLGLAIRKEISFSAMS